MAYVNLGQVIYPVGSIYMSTKNISPGNMFGGVWEKIEDERFWLTVPLSKTAGQTGGEATHKLTIGEMPSHNHRLWNGYGENGGSRKVLWWINRPEGNSAWYNNTFGEFVGGNQPHNNMPPYRTCYSWIRTS